MTLSLPPRIAPTKGRGETAEIPKKTENKNILTENSIIKAKRSQTASIHD
jgi:hypothetical protein